jgi:Mrp family chromosome partitioning ATPase
MKAVQDTLLGDGDGDGNAVSATAQIPGRMDPLELETAMRRHIGNGLKGMTVFPNISRPLTPIEPLTKDAYQTMLTQVAESAEFYAALGDSGEGENCASGACPVK